jgi:GNAT superfamily N-acetyltransferase
MCIIIRQAINTPADVQLLAQFEMAACGNPWPDSFLESTFYFTQGLPKTAAEYGAPQAKKIYSFILTENGHGVAAIIFTPLTYNEFYVTCLYTKEEHRRRGYATQLLEHLVQAYKGTFSLLITEDAPNAPVLVDFYEKHQFFRAIKKAIPPEIRALMTSDEICMSRKNE